MNVSKLSGGSPTLARERVLALETGWEPDSIGLASSRICVYNDPGGCGTLTVGRGCVRANGRENDMSESFRSRSRLDTTFGILPIGESRGCLWGLSSSTSPYGLNGARLISGV